MSCDVTEEEIEDEYRTPDGMTDEERELQQAEVNLARSRAMRAAQQAGRGPASVEMAGHKAALKAKADAHDRYHLRELRERQQAPDGAAEKVPVHVLAKKATG